MFPCLKDASDSCLMPGVEDGARRDGTLSEQYCRKCDLENYDLLQLKSIIKLHCEMGNLGLPRFSLT